MKTTLICWIHGDPHGNSYAIDIDRNKTIAHLKKAVVTESPNCFNGFDAYQLDLCLNYIPETEKAMNEFVFKDR